MNCAPPPYTLGIPTSMPWSNKVQEKRKRWIINFFISYSVYTFQPLTSSLIILLSCSGHLWDYPWLLTHREWHHYRTQQAVIPKSTTTQLLWHLNMRYQLRKLTKRNLIPSTDSKTIQVSVYPMAENWLVVCIMACAVVCDGLIKNIWLWNTLDIRFWALWGPWVQKKKSVAS